MCRRYDLSYRFADRITQKSVTHNSTVIYLEYFLAYLEDGIQVIDVSKLRKNYLQSKYIYLDVLSLIPTDFILFIFHDLAVVRLNKLLKCHRIGDFIDLTEMRTNYPNVFRVIKLMSTCALIFHWNGCFYFWISTMYNYRGIDPIMNIYV